MQTSALCSKCGASHDPSLQSVGTLSRKIVSVLFADLKGSTRAISGIDAESAMLLLRPLLAVMSAAVRDHGGTLLEMRGDGIYASFGAADATEDHALAASRAAIDIKQRLKVAGRTTLPVHIGINTGEVCTQLGWRL